MKPQQRWNWWCPACGSAPGPPSNQVGSGAGRTWPHEEGKDQDVIGAGVWGQVGLTGACVFGAS